MHHNEDNSRSDISLLRATLILRPTFLRCFHCPVHPENKQLSYGVLEMASLIPQLKNKISYTPQTRSHQQHSIKQHDVITLKLSVL